MATVAIYSPKGGVGKSTMAVNLAWCAATHSARRTLLWDLDPQAASSWLLGQPPVRDQARAVLSRDLDPAERIAPTAVSRLDLLPADTSLQGLDRFFHALDRRKRLQRIAEALDYDRVILDCPPGLGETADQVLRAADLVVVPVIPSPLSVRALEALERHGHGGRTLLPVFSMVDGRRRLHADVLADHPDWLSIPMSAQVEAAAAAQAPVGVFAPRSPAAQAFVHVWRRIEDRLAG